MCEHNFVVIGKRTNEQGKNILGKDIPANSYTINDIECSKCQTKSIRIVDK